MFLTSENDGLNYSKKIKFLDNVKKHHQIRTRRQLQFNLFNNDLRHGYYQKRKQLPSGIYSPFREIDTKIPYNPRNKDVKSRFLNPIGQSKRQNNTLEMMDDYDELKEETERKELKSRNVKSLRSQRTQLSHKSSFTTKNRSIFELDRRPKIKSLNRNIS